MKKIIRTLSVILLLSLLLPNLSACRFLRDLFRKERGVSAEEPTSLTYLFAGLDNAAENTDVILSIGYDVPNDTLSIVQIPRDTYCDFGGSQNKINQYFAHLRLAGKTKKEALYGLQSLLEETLGVTYDGCFAIDVSAFRDLVDALGGIDVTLDHDLTLTVDRQETELKAGQNHLNGALAELFVRNRKGYSMGDLSRLDTQKIFYKALFDRVRSGVSLSEAFPVFRILCEEGITDLSLSDAVTLYTKYRSRLSDASVRCMTIPGAPALSETGLSYYIIAGKGAENTVKTYLFAEKDFDPAHRFCDGTRRNFSDIYFDDGIAADVSDFS